jgi:PAP2 superfamily
LKRNFLATTPFLLSESFAPKAADHRFTLQAMAGLSCVLLIFGALIIGIARAQDIRYGPIFAGFMMLSLWAGLSISGIAQCVAIATPGRWRLDIRAMWVMIAVCATGITLPLFELFKQHILPARGFPLDPYVASIDRFLFAGYDGWEVTHALFGSVSATLFLDRIYALWLPMMFAFPMVAVMGARDERLRVRLLGCWLASWVLIAGLGAWIFGSAGPCYYNALVGPDTGFAALNAKLSQLAAAAHAQGQVIAALDFQALLLAGHGNNGLLPAGGISAMPSMHVAMATLFALGAYQISRVLGWAFSVYALLIWIGSVHLGWHYAADGLAGGAMMALLWELSGKVVASRNSTA